MASLIPVLLNDVLIHVPIGSTVKQAVQSGQPESYDAVRQGRAYLTDGRAIRLDLDVIVFPGAIIRVVSSARKTSDPASPA